MSYILFSVAFKTKGNISENKYEGQIVVFGFVTPRSLVDGLPTFPRNLLRTNGDKMFYETEEAQFREYELIQQL